MTDKIEKKDILERLNEALGVTAPAVKVKTPLGVNGKPDPDEAIREVTAKALSLKSAGFGHYNGPSGKNYKWDTNTKRFIETAENEHGSGSVDNIIQHFEQKYRMVRQGRTKLRDVFGGIWKIGTDKLSKVGKSG